MENISFHPNGFLKNSEYSAHYHSFFNSREELKHLENVEVYLNEEVIVGSRTPPTTEYIFSDDGKTAKIVIPFSLFYLKTNKLSPVPTPENVFNTLNQTMKIANDKYNSRFPEPTEDTKEKESDKTF